MVTTRARRRYSLEEYIEFEAYSNVKHEFVAGELIGMAGGTRAHCVRTMTIGRMLGNGLEGRPCAVQSGDVRIRIDAADLNTYPDISVVCGPALTHAIDRDAVTNPCLIVEILSPTTEAYDRGDKLDAYKQLESVREVLFVAHDTRRLDCVQRTPHGWRTLSAGPGESLVLELGITTAVDDVYFDPTEH